MTKTATIEPEVQQKDETKQQRKKQAKKEARAMLKIERAKKDLKKAQKKVARAQSNLDENQTHLHDLEEKLQQIRLPQESQVEETPAPQTSLDEVPELQPEDFKTQEVSDEARQEPLLLDAISSDEPSFPQNDTDVSADTSDDVITPSTEAIAETDTTTPSSPDEYQNTEEREGSQNHNASPLEEAMVSDTPDYSNHQEENQ